MRTAVLLGFMYVGYAIGTPPDSTDVAAFIGTVLLVCMAMDVVDFLRGRQTP